MLFATLNVFYLNISTSLRTCEVSSMAVCCSPLMSCIPGMLFRYCLNDNEMVPVDHIITAKGKAISLQAWRAPEGSRRLRVPDFKTIGT